MINEKNIYLSHSLRLFVCLWHWEYYLSIIKPISIVQWDARSTKHSDQTFCNIKFFWRNSKWRKCSLDLACCKHVTKICDRICKCMSCVDGITRQSKRLMCAVAVITGKLNLLVDIVVVVSLVATVVICLRLTRGPRSSCTAKWIQTYWNIE